MKIDHVHFYVEDAREWRNWFVQKMRFQAIANGTNNHTRTEVVRSGSVTFALSSPLTSASPVARFLSVHPPGVADVAFGVSNLEKVIQKAIAKGANVQKQLQQRQFPQGQLRWCQIVGVTGLYHTLIERTGVTPVLPYNWLDYKSIAASPEINFAGIDHLVLNVATGKLQETVSWYENALGFQRQQTFSIQTERSALYSQVMVHPVSGVQFPVNEPASPNSQVQEFLDVNRGAGIQHIALVTPQIVGVTNNFRCAGLSFLSVPATYYKQLRSRHPDLSLSAADWKQIAQAQILVDFPQVKLLPDESQSEPILLQIFTQPIFGQPTFFFELIERRSQAKGFGEGNFRALFEAIEQEQIKRGTLQ